MRLREQLSRRGIGEFLWFVIEVKEMVMGFGLEWGLVLLWFELELWLEKNGLLG